MRALLLPPILLVLLMLPAPAAAQGSCTLVEAPGGAFRGVDRGTPQEMAYIRRPVLRCPNEMRITADSAVYSRMLNEIQFIGRVRFYDPGQELDADFARYLMQQRQLIAQGSVVLRDLEHGSSIHAATLDYLMESAVRPESRIDVPSGRPRSMIVRAAAEPGMTADTTIVDSDALTIVGDHTFIGRGNVDLRRGNLHGEGDLLNFAQETGAMRLTGAARLTSDDYRLAGHEIVVVVENDTLRTVDARGDARLETDDATVEAPAIHVLFEAGEVHRLIALAEARAGARAPAAAAAPSGLPARVPDRPAPQRSGDVVGPAAQARVTAREFRMIADSIDALAPAQQLEHVVAVGAAFAERLLTDSTEIVAADSLPDIIARDWVRGDTIVARFAAHEPVVTVPTVDGQVRSQADTEPAGQRTERALESLTVLAGERLASSAYRRRDDSEPYGLTINYVLARHILVTLEAGEVTAVEATGDVQGVYLSPTAVTAASTRGQDDSR